MPDLRIVSLCPSLSETLVELGVVPVGVTRYCNRPREVLRKVSKVGGTKNPDLERIRILDPTLSDGGTTWGGILLPPQPALR